jgi:hypothetical protein
MATKNNFFTNFSLFIILILGATFTSFFKEKKVKKKSQNRRNEDFFFLLFLLDDKWDLDPYLVLTDPDPGGPNHTDPDLDFQHW